MKSTMPSPLGRQYLISQSPVAPAHDVTSTFRYISRDPPGLPASLAITLPEQRQKFAALLDLEETAKRITIVTPLLVPGLLQTNEYIRAIMTGGSVPTIEVAARIAVRVGRKEVLSQPDPPCLFALVGEAALSQLVGSAEIMAGQLTHLATMTQWSNV